MSHIDVEVDHIDTVISHIITHIPSSTRPSTHPPSPARTAATLPPAAAGQLVCKATLLRVVRFSQHEAQDRLTRCRPRCPTLHAPRTRYSYFLGLKPSRRWRV